MASKTPAIWASLGRINTTDFDDTLTANGQRFAKVIGLANGGFVVAWEDDTSMLTGFEPNDIAGQMFSVFGATVGGELLISTNYADYNQQRISLAPLPTGGFVAAYQTFGDPLLNDGENIDVSFFGPDGIYERHEDFRQGFSPMAIDDTMPSIATFSGGYVLAYVSNENGDNDIVYHIVTSPFSFPVPPPPAVTAASGAGSQTAPQVTILDKPGLAFAITFEDEATGAVRVYLGDANGQVGSTLTVSAGGFNGAPAVTALAGGALVVAWTNEYDNTGAGADIFFRIVGSDGILRGAAPSQVNTTAVGRQSQAAVEALSDGGFAVTWTDSQKKTVFVQIFDAAGAKVGSEFAVSVPAGSSIADPDITSLSDGRLVLTYTLTGSDGNDDVHGVILDARLGPVTGTAAGETLTSPMVGGTVLGLGGDDFIYGSGANDTLNGGAGIDTLYGGAGTDVLHGGADADRLYGGTGSDKLYGGDGEDYLYGGSDGDYLYGGTGIDRLRGGDGVDRLYGGADDDYLYGEAGDDRLYGDAGVDRLYGGAGGDYLYGGDDADYLYGEAARDWLYGGNGDDRGFGGAGNDDIYGGDGIDRLYGGDDDDKIYGGSDTDYLYGDAGNDYIYGGSDNDYLYGGIGRVRLYGGDATDRLYGGAGNDFLHGGDATDRLYGGDEDDYLYGDAGSDVLYGEAGSDRLYGGANSDTMYGGDSDDRFYGGSGNDKMYGGDGVDYAYYSGNRADYSIVIGASVVVTHLTGSDGIDTLIDIERIVFADQTIAFS